MSQPITKTEQKILSGIAASPRGVYFASGKREVAAARKLASKGLAVWEPAGGYYETRDRRGNTKRHYLTAATVQAAGADA